MAEKGTVESSETVSQRNSHLWLVTSCKGGVGKSTCAVGIAAALSQCGRTVLLIDCDFGVRCLDLMLGVEDKVVYDLYDVAKRQIPAERAVMKIDGFQSLYFLPAPLSGDMVKRKDSEAAERRGISAVEADTDVKADAVEADTDVKAAAVKADTDVRADAAVEANAADVAVKVKAAVKADTDVRADAAVEAVADVNADTEMLTGEDFSRLFDLLQEDRSYDYILIDTPAGRLSPALLAARRIDGGIIVASHSAASIRAAGLTGQSLEENGILSQRLIINRFDFRSAADGSLPGINEIIDRTCIRLGGIVPEDGMIMRLAEEGKTQTADSNTGRAFAHIAERLEGRYIPLFEGFTGMKVRRQIKKLLGL